MKLGLSTLLAALALDILEASDFSGADALHIDDWKTHNFDELDVCLYNGFLRTKKVRESRGEAKASRFLKSGKSTSHGLFTTSALSTSNVIFEPSQCVPDTSNCSGNERSYAFLVEQLDANGDPNGTMYCLKGLADSADADVLHPDGTGTVEVHVSCSDCYTDGYSDKGRWPSDSSDGYIVKFFVIDRCNDPSDRCSACGEKCRGGGSGKGGSGKGGSGVGCSPASPLNISGAKSKSGSKTKSGSARRLSGKSSSSDVAIEPALTTSGCDFYYDDLCCIADGNCEVPAATAPPTIATQTEPPTSAPTPCPINCKDISGGAEKQAEWYLSEGGNPSVDDYEKAGCAPPFVIEPCCFDWCDNGEVRDSSQFIEECTPPPTGYDCAPSAAPSESPTDGPTSSPTPCPEWCGEMGTPYEQAKWYLDNKGNPSCSDYAAANCGCPSGIVPCCFDWCDNGEVRDSSQFYGECEPPPAGYDCAPSAAPSESPTDGPTSAPTPCPEYCGEIPGSPYVKAKWYLDNNGNPDCSDFAAANCACPGDLAPCCFDWCDDGEVRDSSQFIGECAPPPDGYDCAPSASPSESPTDEPTSAPTPCPEYCGEIPGTPYVKAKWYLDNNGNPDCSDFAAANCACPGDLAPCCFSWCDDGEVRDVSQFIGDCAPPPDGYDCAPSASPSESPTQSPIESAQTEMPTPTMSYSMSYRYLEEMFEE